MKTKLSNSSLGPLRRRKQEIAAKNAERVSIREEHEYFFQLNLYTLFVLIHRLGQEVPREAWEKNIRASKGTASVDEVLEQVAKLGRVPEEYVCGFPENMYEWVMANQERAIKIARDLSVAGWEWWEDRNWIISGWVIGHSYDHSDPDNRYRFARTAHYDYLLDLFYSDEEATKKAIAGLKAFYERREKAPRSKRKDDDYAISLTNPYNAAPVQVGACAVSEAVGKSAMSVMEVNNRENERFWKKNFRMVVFIVMAYAAIVSIILWKVATS